MSDPDTGATTGPATETVARPPARWRVVLTAVLGTVLVLGLVAVGYLTYRLQHPTTEPFRPTAGSSVPVDSERRDALDVAEQFALRMDTVDGTDLDGYVKGINAMLTTKARTENVKTFDAMKQSYAAAKVKGKGEVLQRGIADIDADSATVLVAHDADVTTTQGDIEHHYRWSVDLVKVDGEWRVDDFTPVN
ncbi:hypothetical protein ASG49_01610 [Marmoricola sp. Leaf446]|uniref:hypothetical protein n=1 Tax=Marmoricola sp. Leaf446 TaxID=1736379 RepID=UPI0006F711AE|nr:hypothetical protein [Marmoricola sp. Leaf446]KQT93707.1 hypothetical protein ASG49_01610 [Marmoricola sp. Leaf446]